MHAHEFCLPKPDCSCKELMRVHLPKAQYSLLTLFPRADMAGLRSIFLALGPLILIPAFTQPFPSLRQDRDKFLFDTAHAHMALEHCKVLLWGAHTDSGLTQSTAKQQCMRKRAADSGYNRGDLHSVHASVVCACIQAIDLVQHGHLDDKILYRDRCSAQDTNEPTVVH